MARLFAPVIAALAAGLLWAAGHSARFNAEQPSPALVRSLAPDYLAVDALYGEAASPIALGSALRWFLPPDSIISGIEIWRPLSSAVLNADQGLRLAGEGERAVAGLGATAELAPARRDLLASYAAAAQAWRLEGQVVQAVEHNAQAPRRADYPGALATAETSMDQIRQAGLLHDRAMESIQRLTAAAPLAVLPAAGDGRDQGQ